MSKDMDDLGDSPQEEETNETTTETMELPVCYIATGKMTWDEAHSCIEPNKAFAYAFLCARERYVDHNGEPYSVSDVHSFVYDSICYKEHSHGETCICVLESGDYYDYPELKRLEFGRFCQHYDPSPDAGLDGAPSNLVRIRYRYNCKDCGDTCMLECCTFSEYDLDIGYEPTSVTNVFS